MYPDDNTSKKNVYKREREIKLYVVDNNSRVRARLSFLLEENGMTISDGLLRLYDITCLREH